ncbi:hypothetical protein F4808DRAFT_459191 [Astrocystis sublimbata]|nr:hypothetical protein F4808DRAFT_459191 [Astrocystis sublimbata]
MAVLARIIVTTLAAFAAGVTAIAENPIDACNCPNNCDYTVGHECKFFASENGGIFGGRPIASGTCQEPNGDSNGQIWCFGEW